MKQVRTINPGEVYRLNLESSALTVIDVRSPEEFKEVHASIAVNLPLDQFNAESVRAMGFSEDDCIYLICRSGARSEKACRILMDSGFDHVFNISGGTVAWEKSGLPLAKNEMKRGTV